MTNKQLRFFDIMLYVCFGLTLILALWFAIAWYTYPCEAFKTGILANSSLPGRCVDIKKP